MSNSDSSNGYPFPPLPDLGSDSAQQAFFPTMDAITQTAPPVPAASEPPVQAESTMQQPISPSPETPQSPFTPDAQNTATEPSFPMTPAAPAAEQTPISQPTVPVAPPAPPVQPAASEASNPIASAFDQMEETETKAAQQNLFAKRPIFKFAGVSEPIEGDELTFDELRLQKVADFPELDEGKTTWSVTYGKIVKAVVKPKTQKIAELKREIETSKEFVEALKKAKDKNPDCLVIPRVAAEKKGKLPAYKGIYPDFLSAISSGKLISLVPGRDGHVHEIRNNDMGMFVTPTEGHQELSPIEAGFTPALPPVPSEVLDVIISFFRRGMFTPQGDFEALAHILWDKEKFEYIVSIPDQVVSAHSVIATTPEYDEARFIHYISIHSHNSMRAYFSKIDDADEKATRVYAVVGRLQDYYPDIKVRISNGGNFLNIHPQQVFTLDEIAYPSDWDNKISVRKGHVA